MLINYFCFNVQTCCVKVKLAVAHALAQSSKLSTSENRLSAIVEQTMGLPEALAAHGHIHLSQRTVAKLIGQVFLQRTAVTLFSPIMDTPEFFWEAEDYLQVSGWEELR